MMWLSALLPVLLLASGQMPSSTLTKLDPLARRALARFQAGAAAERVEGRMSATPAGELDVFIRGNVTRQELEAAGARVRTEMPGLFTAYIPADAVEAVAALPGVRKIRGSAPVQLELDASVPSTGVTPLRGAGPTFNGLNGNGVLVGTVDSGVDYAHSDFDDAAGNTRLVRIWDQTVSTGAPAPPGFGYGVEWTSAQINSNQCTTTDLIGHGTHVLGIAAGDGSQTGNGVPAYTYVGMAPRADLVVVKTDFQTTGVVDGVKYIFDLATARSQNAVVNLSLGSHFGPHDGTDDFEEGLSALTGAGRIIVKSAGNNRGEARHAEVFAAGVGTDATLSVNGSSTGRLFVVDGYYESSENVNVLLRTPNGTLIGPVTRGNANLSYPGAPTANGSVYLENGLEVTPDGDFEVYLEVNITAGQNMNGTWTLTFVPAGLGPAQGEVDLWQFFASSGVTADFVTGNQPTQELISEPGNAVGLITVAAWVTKESWFGCNGLEASFMGKPPVGNLAVYSSPGPTRDGRQKPDIAAPGSAIASVTSFDVTPFCPGPSNPTTLIGDGLNHTVMEGTSMASPHVVGAAAILMQTFGAMTPAQISTYLKDHALTDANTGAVWNADWGNGKLHIDQSSATLLALFQAAPARHGVEVRWQLNEPEQFSSVSLERSVAESGPWAAVATELRAEGVMTVALDESAESGKTYFYRLVAQARDGRTHVFGPLPVTAGVPLLEFQLATPAPNPAAGPARIEFSVPREAPLRLSVVDIQGREVALLAEGLHRPGRYQALWSGESAGRPAPAGLYFIRLHTPERDLVGRLIIAR